MNNRNDKKIEKDSAVGDSTQTTVLYNRMCIHNVYVELVRLANDPNVVYISRAV